MQNALSPTALLIVNGESVKFTGQFLAELLDSLPLSGKRYAVELNGQIIPRSQHADTLLHENDRIEIVTAVGGG